MTTPSPVDDPVERLLASALRSARTDDRWAVATAPGLAHRVRRATSRQRRYRAAVAATAGVAALGGATAGLAQLGGGGQEPVDSVFATSAPTTTTPPVAGPPPSPVAGISPEFTPAHGRDWLLSDEQFARFAESHTTPSPRPNPVQSPAPLTDYSARLLVDVEAALPAGSSAERQDALNGDPATAGIHAALPDGTRVEVDREPLQTPVPVDSWYAGSGAGTPQVDDVPGSDSALVSLPEVGYGWGPGIPDGARLVAVVRRDGEVTRWYAPLSVPLETVQQWALAAEAAGR